jgi:hypothetical protein
MVPGEGFLYRYLGKNIAALVGDGADNDYYTGIVTDVHIKLEGDRADHSFLRLDSGQQVYYDPTMTTIEAFGEPQVAPDDINL